MKFMGYFKEQAFDCDGNKYDETLVDEDSFENHYRPSSNEVRGHSLMGTIGEIYIRRKLRDDGYQTARINQFYGRDKLELGKVKTEGWNKLNVEEIEELLKDYTGDKELVMQLLANNKRGLPDFLCLKEGKLFFFEVKSKRPPIRLYCKIVEALKEAHVFEYEMKTSEKKQKKTIGKLKFKIQGQRE